MNIWDRFAPAVAPAHGGNADSAPLASGPARAGIWGADQFPAAHGDRVAKPGWEFADSYAPQVFKPQRTDDWELKKLATKKGEAYYVLKNLRQVHYVRLSESQAYLWDLMDGTRTVQDLAVENLLRFHTLATDGLLALINQLRANGVPTVPPERNICAALGRQLYRGRPEFWLRRAIAAVL